MLSELPVSIGRLTISGTKMTMTEPKLSGYTRDERRYELTANAAVQDASKVDVVNLEEPRANLEMSDGSTVSMKAAIGVFDRKAGILTLRRDVVVTSTSGYEMRLSQAVIDVRNGNIVSDQPVSVKMQQGTLQGNRFEVIKSGEVVRFDGGVTMMLAPDKCRRTRQQKDDAAMTISRQSWPASVICRLCRDRRRCDGRARAIGSTRAERAAGFSQNRDKPVQIKAQTFEVRDKDKVATFSGNVHVVQGDTTIRCKSLIVTYTDGFRDAGGARTPQPGPGGNSADQQARGARRRRRHAEGSDRDRRQRLFRSAHQHRHAHRQCRGQPGRQRHARRSHGGRSDHGSFAGRIRQSPAGPCEMLIPQSQPNSPEIPGAVRGVRACSAAARSRCARLSQTERVSVPLRG